MAFYKRDGEELLSAPNFVYGPGFELRAENRNQYNYPVEGWHWYDTLDEAMEAMIAPKPIAQISMYQARLRLAQMNQLIAVQLALSDLAEPQKSQAAIAWEYAPYIIRSHPLVLMIQAALGWSDAQTDDFFNTAATL